jgi:hypothetical protein
MNTPSASQPPLSKRGIYNIIRKPLFSKRGIYNIIRKPPLSERRI